MLKHNFLERIVSGYLHKHFIKKPKLLPWIFNTCDDHLWQASVNSVDDLQNATRSGDPYYELADDLKWPANYAPTGEGIRSILPQNVG